MCLRMYLRLFHSECPKVDVVLRSERTCMQPGLFYV